MGAGQYLALGVVNRADREGGAVFLGGKANSDVSAPDANDGAGRAGVSATRASDRSKGNTQELCCIKP
jgi:hypothetical protein